MRSINILPISLLILIATTSFTYAAAKEPTLSEKILTFCRQHKAEQVGDGECSSLADHALKESNAKGRSDEKPNKGDYVWGEPIYTQDASQPKPEGKRTDIKPG